MDPGGRGATWRLAGVGIALAVAGTAAPAVTAAPRAREIRVLEVKGVINPLSARYLARELGAARDAALFVVELDTPGGLDSSMRAMTQAILGSPTPVVVYVAPEGARAASAGMFLTVAAHVAAMAPGTNIGAAHPVALGGDGDAVRAGKLVNDAAAFARALAEARGRNAAWVERAVRESDSITAEEAVRLGVVDLVAGDLAALLRALDGRRVTTAAGEITLRTEGARVRRSPMGLEERVLHAIADPDVAYLLFTLGLLGLAVELYSPGLLLPGILGAIALILAFVAFGNLPVNWAGVLLIALAVGLFVLELATEGFGVLAAGALVAFVLGSLLLYRPLRPTSPATPDLQVSRWLVFGLAAALAAFFALVLRAAIRARRLAVATGVEALVGRAGVALSELDPAGLVGLAGERWTAQAARGPIHAGEAITVIGVEGVTLRVTRAEAARP